MATLFSSLTDMQRWIETPTETTVEIRTIMHLNQDGNMCEFTIPG